jgi:hypothetical protein
MPSDFDQWPASYDAVMTLPSGARSQCDDSIPDALAEERALEQALQQRQASEAEQRAADAARRRDTAAFLKNIR